jgi:ubiquitin carboxyl-terminal hydrolase 22/27/51
MDYVYDTRFLKINEKNQYKAAKISKRSITFMPWLPSENEIQILKQHPKRIITENNRIGLRGLYNLGSTCFMNCIIQVLVHSPVLRDYFLSDRHDCKISDKSNCIVCEISNIFQEFYSGKGTPISLHDLLVLIWKNASHLAGYKQQDAHEFFIATLNLLHSHFRDSSKSQSDPCNCIIDEIFTGELLSDLVCSTCGHISPTFEPFKDLSLDLSFDTGGQPKSLIHCLERFTRLEHLGVKLTCSKCNTEREFTKELSIETLPIIASFHLKRFEQTCLNDKKKISTFIAFPDELDLTPFLSKSQESQHLNRASAKYQLYAVVNHEGKSIDVGHYTTYIKHTKNCWIKCDDLNLISYSLDRVLSSEGYLLFYHKKILEYN